jgi:peptidoglycan/LPS O-acetylase OafA/YrhL
MISFHPTHEKILSQQPAPEKKNPDFLYLPGLNGIRAIAALAVVVLHTCFSLKNINLGGTLFGRDKNGIPLDYFFGQYAVSIFFVLSGFLITYLLLLEKDKKDISIRKFYLRRIFRIWPLYYMFMLAMVALITFFKIPFDAPSLIFYIFLVPNLIPNFLGLQVTPVPFVNHFWSIGIEEQFYLFWPWVIKQRKFKVLTPVLIIIAVMFASRLFLNTYYPDSVIAYFFKTNRFDCMLIGAAGAILYKKNFKRSMRFIDNKVTQLVALLAGVLYAGNIIHFEAVIDHLFISIITIIIIIGQINVANRIVNLDIPIFRFLGKISFGVYVYHQLFIFLFTKLYKNVLYDGFPKYFLMFASVLASTIIVSHLSYKYFESWFIKRKNKYSVIHSTPSGTYEKASEITVYPEKAYSSN